MCVCVWVGCPRRAYLPTRAESQKPRAESRAHHRPVRERADLRNERERRLLGGRLLVEPWHSAPRHAHRAEVGLALGGAGQYSHACVPAEAGWGGERVSGWADGACRQGAGEVQIVYGQGAGTGTDTPVAVVWLGGEEGAVEEGWVEAAGAGEWGG